MSSNTEAQPKSTKAEYFHKVRMTHFAAKALTAEVAAYTGDDLVIQFTNKFDFRIVDRTDPKRVRDYGWYRSWDEVFGKFARLYPNLIFSAYALDERP